MHLSSVVNLASARLSVKEFQATCTGRPPLRKVLWSSCSEPKRILSYDPSLLGMYKARCFRRFFVSSTLFSGYLLKRRISSHLRSRFWSVVSAEHLCSIRLRSLRISWSYGIFVGLIDSVRIELLAFWKNRRNGSRFRRQWLWSPGVIGRRCLLIWLVSQSRIYSRTCRLFICEIL